jgi:hypothetical protein
MAQTTAASVSRTLTNKFRRSESYAGMIRGANWTSEGYEVKTLGRSIYIDWRFGNTGLPKRGASYDEIRINWLNEMASFLINKGYEVSMTIRGNYPAIKVTAKY